MEGRGAALSHQEEEEEDGTIHTMKGREREREYKPLMTPY